MSLPIPLGVRIWNNQGHSVDVWVTPHVDDLSFRSVVPGGFANATITLHRFGALNMDQLAQVLNRVQIVDLRSNEIAWEGRIDSIQRHTDSDTWELGCLGSMVVASDIQRPMFYIDSDVRSWAVNALGDLFHTTVNADTRSLTISPSTNTTTGPVHIVPLASHVGAQRCGVYLARFDATYSGSGANANTRTGMDVVDSSLTRQTNVDLTAWNAASVRKANLIVTDITSTTAQRLELSWDLAASYTVGAGDFGTVGSPVVQVQRVDETGAKLQTAASYPQEYLTVEQIVRDVVGRFLVGAWYSPTNNTPYTGQVGSEGIYIDTSSTARITHLTYYDGATAADILGDLMTAQPDAYWALWESRYGATTAVNPLARYRFEWVRWPTSPTYHATSIDGLEEQPDGGQLVNFVWLQHELISPVGSPAIQQVWDTSNENQLINDAQIVRGVTVQASEPLSGSDALTRATALLAAYKRTANTGTLTVRRPIAAYDSGDSSYSGVARMLDPWLIRPGELIRIADIPPRSNGNTFAGAGIVSDSFDTRTVSNGWGNADTGQPWTTDGGSASDYSVSGGVGRITMATVNTSRFVTVPSPGPDFRVFATVAVSLAPVTDSQFIYLVGRYTDANNAYVLRAQLAPAGTVTLDIRKRVAGSESSIISGVVAGLSPAANRRFGFRFEADGSSLRAKMWLASADEPTAWNLTATDTALTDSGSVGHRAVLGATSTVFPVVSYDNFLATAPQAYAPELDGTVFRVVGTTYSSSDNSCVLELDQPPAWNTATQVLESGSSSNLVVRG